jgi:hypothetical protein
MAEPLKRVFTGQGPLISDEVTKKGLGSLYDFSGDSFNKTQDAKKAFGTGILSELLKMGRQEVVPNKEIISTETPVSDIFGDFSLSGLNTMGSRDSIYREDEEDRFNEKYGNIDITEFDPDEFPTIIDIPGITNTAGTSTKLEEAAGELVAQDPSEIEKLIPEKAEEKFFTGQPSKPKPGEMMDDQFFKYPDATFPGTEKAMEDTFKEALLDTAKAKGETVTPETQEDLLAKYKKEFYDATGLDSSGKVDKSAALMALGLSLMQNKAGSKFNVGKMLSEVGRAGEKALPELTKAKATAKAEQVAAGKYALGQIQAGKSASAALAKERRALNQARDLKILELNIDAKKDKRAGLEVKGVKNVKYFNGFDIEMGRNATGAKFALPGNALNKTESAMEKINGALTKTDEIDLLLSLYDGNQVGGTAGEIALNRTKAMANRFGANFEFKDGSNLDPRLQIESLGNSIIAEYKKMLTQESGNGISNTDVNRLVELLGKPGELLTIEQLKMNVGSIREIFMSKKQEIDGVANLLQDPAYYALESEWEENKERAMNLKRVKYNLVNGEIITSAIPRISVISKD